MADGDGVGSSLGVEEGTAEGIADGIAVGSVEGMVMARESVPYLGSKTVPPRASQLGRTKD